MSSKTRKVRYVKQTTPEYKTELNNRFAPLPSVTEEMSPDKSPVAVTNTPKPPRMIITLKIIAPW